MSSNVQVRVQSSAGELSSVLSIPIPKIVQQVQAQGREIGVRVRVDFGYYGNGPELNTILTGNGRIEHKLPAKERAA